MKKEEIKRGDVKLKGQIYAKRGKMKSIIVHEVGISTYQGMRKKYFRRKGEAPDPDALQSSLQIKGSKKELNKHENKTKTKQRRYRVRQPGGDVQKGRGLYFRTDSRRL